MNLLKHLRSNQFAIIVAILSVIVQSFHSFTAFYATSSLQNGWGIAQAVLFSIVIDLAILFYTVRGRSDIAMYAAVAMVTINVYYYYDHLGLNLQFIFGCFLSLIIPISVYFYSEEIKDTADPDRDRETIADLGSTVNELHDEIHGLKLYHEKRYSDWEDKVKRLESDLAYAQNQVASELDPDQIEDKTKEKSSITITRTGGHKA